MPEGPLAGLGVLVTRPERQAQSLVDEITGAGGRAYRFPAFDIEPVASEAIAQALADLESPDVLIFVSANAVRCGAEVLSERTTKTVVAAIGPATAAALESRGVAVDIRPSGGFDSESLLADAALQSVSGSIVTIVRGDPGREHLARTLTERGATVQYLSVYAIAERNVNDTEREAVEAALADGSIGATVIMSVRSYECLESLLSGKAIHELGRGTLVAPGGRVIQTLAERLPAARCVEASGTDAESVVSALISSLQDDPNSR